MAAGATLVPEEDHPTPAFDFIFGWIWLLALIAHCVTGLFLGGDRQLCEETFEGHHSPIEGLLWSLSICPDLRQALCLCRRRSKGRVLEMVWHLGTSFPTLAAIPIGYRLNFWFNFCSLEGRLSNFWAPGQPFRNFAPEDCPQHTFAWHLSADFVLHSGRTLAVPQDSTQYTHLFLNNIPENATLPGQLNSGSPFFICGSLCR